MIWLLHSQYKSDCQEQLTPLVQHCGYGHIMVNGLLGVVVK